MNCNCTLPLTNPEACRFCSQSWNQEVVIDPAWYHNQILGPNYEDEVERIKENFEQGINLYITCDTEEHY